MQSRSRSWSRAASRAQSRAPPTLPRPAPRPSSRPRPSMCRTGRCLDALDGSPSLPRSTSGRLFSLCHCEIAGWLLRCCSYPVFDTHNGCHDLRLAPASYNQLCYLAWSAAWSLAPQDIHESSGTGGAYFQRNPERDAGDEREDGKIPIKGLFKDVIRQRNKAIPSTERVEP